MTTAPLAARLARTWPYALPPLAIVALVLSWGRHLGGVPIVVVAVLLTGAVLAAVHHAETVAHWVGEPFGSLILAVAVTVIEVGLIVTMMTSGGPETFSLARDTVFAAVMITCNGIVGLSIITASRRYHMAKFNAEGATASLAAVTMVATLSLVLPVFTLGTPGPQFSTSQLAFAAACSLIVYVLFVVTQNVRHRDLFLPAGELAAASGRRAGPAAAGSTRPGAGSAAGADPVAEPGAAAKSGAAEGGDNAPPSNGEDADSVPRRGGVRALAFLMISLVGVVGLAKVESPAIESGVRALGLPHAFVGVVIALLVLLPETVTATRAAAGDRVQISLNLALGSAMASIGLTIPTIAVAMIWLPGPLILGLSATQIALLVLTVLISTLTLSSGRATRLHGGIHLVILAAFIFLAINP